MHIYIYTYIYREREREREGEGEGEGEREGESEICADTWANALCTASQLTLRGESPPTTHHSTISVRDAWVPLVVPTISNWLVFNLITIWHDIYDTNSFQLLVTFRADRTDSLNE